MMSNIFLKTERLILREFNPGDIALIYTLDSNPTVMEFIRTPTKTMAEANTTYQKIMNTRSKDIRYGNWIAQIAATGQPIGWFCLKDLDNSDEIEVGFRLLPEFWGNGFATEGAKELIRYGFEFCNLEYIAGVTHPLNLRSQSALIKCGLSFKRKDVYYQTPVHYYAISKNEFRQNAK